MHDINETHRADLRSWVARSVPGDTDFPLQNLPFGCFSTADDERPRLGVAIGEQVLDLRQLSNSGLLDGLGSKTAEACRADSLLALMTAPAADASALRLSLSRLLREGAPDTARTAACLVAASSARMQLPVRVRNFSDFFTSIHHATNTGRMSRPLEPLLSNFHSLPVAYHGRASSLAISGTPFPRPMGQQLLPGQAMPVHAPSGKVDLECEIGAYVGQGNALGSPLSIDQAADALFGLSLLNDWSARDLQAWESRPLGPFLAKSTLSTLSPWIVTFEALAPFRTPAAPRAADAGPVLPYLLSKRDQLRGGLDIRMQVLLSTRRMREEGQAPVLVSSPCFRDQYWTLAQMLTHQTSNGCVAETGDLIGSGTVSGPRPGELGCLLEITQGGTQPLTLVNGESRRYLEDGDEVVLRAQCVAEGAVPIGFGDCAGRVVTPG